MRNFQDLCKATLVGVAILNAILQLDFTQTGSINEKNVIDLIDRIDLDESSSESNLLLYSNRID